MEQIPIQLIRTLLKKAAVGGNAGKPGYVRVPIIVQSRGRSYVQHRWVKQTKPKKKDETITPEEEPKVRSPKKQPEQQEDKEKKKETSTSSVSTAMLDDVNIHTLDRSNDELSDMLEEIEEHLSLIFGIEAWEDDVYEITIEEKAPIPNLHLEITVSNSDTRKDSYLIIMKRAYTSTDKKFLKVSLVSLLDTSNKYFSVDKLIESMATGCKKLQNDVGRRCILVIKKDTMIPLTFLFSNNAKCLNHKDKEEVISHLIDNLKHSEVENKDEIIGMISSKDTTEKDIMNILRTKVNRTINIEKVLLENVRVDTMFVSSNTKEM